MSKRIFKILLILCLSVGLTSATLAQVQTGSIKGTVTDDEGIPLPGVTVTASSPAMMGTKSYVTAETGVFRFPALPPGHYSITAELPGFKTLKREEIIVRVGKVITINFAMEMTTIEEEVTVVAASPVVDMQQSKIAVIMDKELLKNIPMARDLYDIVNAAPGAISEEQSYRRTSSIHGATVRSNVYAFDGVTMNDPVVMYPLTNINFDVMDEVEMVMGAHPASTGYCDGAYINVVTRSGGNEFSGGATFYFTNESFAQHLWPEEQVQALDISKPAVDKTWIDGSLTFGGPIVKDKLWFFSNVRYIKMEKTTTFKEFTDILGRSHGAYDWSHNEVMGFFKLTSQLTSNLKFAGMFNYVMRNRPMYEEPGTYTTYIATRMWDHEKDYTGTGILSYILNQNTFFELRAGYVSRLFPIPLQEEARGLPWINDYAEPWGSITTARFNETYLRKRFQSGAYFTRFQDNFLGGNHEFKGGLEFEHAYGDWDWWRKDNLLWYWDSRQAGGGPYYYGTVPTYTHSLTGDTYDDVGRGRIYFYICSDEAGKTKIIDNARRIGAYIQDSVTFGERLTVNVGLRFDRTWGWKPAVTKGEGGNPMSVYIGEKYIKPYIAKNWPDDYPEGFNPYAEYSSEEWKDIMIWNSFSPRIGLTYDLFGDGRTALKASFSRYTEYMMLQYFSTLHSFYPRSMRFYWYDTDKDGVLGTADDYEVYKYDYRVMDPTYSKNKLNPDAKSPVNDELTFGIWHELFENFSLGVNFLYKDKKNIYEDVMYDPDNKEYWYHWDQPKTKEYYVPFQAIVPGADDYPDQNVTVYIRSNDAPEIFYQATNCPELKRKYWALEFLFNKRMADGWQFNGSIVYSKAYGNIGGMYDQSWGWSGAGDSPNTFYNAYGRTNIDRPLQIKLMGTAALPYRIFLSAYYRFSSGSPWIREGYIVPPKDWCEANNADQDYYWVNFEDRNEPRRNRTFNILDLRLEKEFMIGDFGKLGAYIDVLNILGWSNLDVGRQDVQYYFPSAENVSEPGNVTIYSSYKVPREIEEGVRTFKFSIRFSF